MSADEGLGGPASDSALQFDHAELASPAAGRVCAGCQRAIGDEYFEFTGRIICPPCRGALSPQGSTSAFLRGLLFGGSAALLGTIVWFAVVKITDHEFGLVAIAIGLLVGKAVRKGSGGRGGWKYQTLAIALTYVSITASYVPLVVKQLASGGAKLAGEVSHDAGGGAGTPPGTLPGPPAAETASPPVTAAPPLGAGQVLLAFAVVFGIRLRRPVPGRRQQHHGDHHHRHRALRGLEDQPANTDRRALPRRIGARRGG